MKIPINCNNILNPENKSQLINNYFMIPYQPVLFVNLEYFDLVELQT